MQWTDCWRGYHGTWLISEDRLYFTGIEALFKDGSPATLAKLFPGQDTPVFASVYSGELRIPHGRCLRSSLVRCRAIFEFDLLITINRGLVVSRQTRTNYYNDDE
ncbi:MAG: hypothetical protein WBP11_15855 [Dokdonella sp.]